MEERYESAGKIYTLEEVKDFWRSKIFVCYNDRDFYEWLERQLVLGWLKKIDRQMQEG